MTDALSRKQRRVIAALLTHPTTEAAAEATGVADRTIRRWLQHPAFRSELEGESRHIVDFAAQQMRGAATKAVEALARNLEPDAPPAQQVSAARVVLEHVRQTELAELEQRLEALERAESEK